MNATSTSTAGPRPAAWMTMVAVAALCAACARTPVPSQDATVRSEVARLQRGVAVLQHQLELAAGKDFYLVLDASAPDLTLMLRGAELQRYPVLGLQVGQPRVAWIGRSQARPWQDVIWSDGELDPPRQLDRLVIEAAPPGKDTDKEEEPPIPPTPEELYPVPPRYHIRFADGRSLEIRPREADETLGRLARAWAWWNGRWRDAIAAVGGGDHDAIRLRVVLQPKDANSLYRSLPPETKLIVLARDGSAPGPAAPARPAVAGH